MNEDFLTDLPIELTAQFKGVNMPLKKLMELEAGGVLPLGLLLDSDLALMAPGNKAIAKGKLVIVGNQFALKITDTKLGADTYPRAKLDESALSQSLSSVAVKNNNASSTKKNLSITEDMSLEDDADDNLSMPHLSKKPLAEMDPSEREALSQKLDQELQDIGLDPEEFDELEDLY